MGELTLFIMGASAFPTARAVGCKEIAPPAVRCSDGVGAAHPARFMERRCPYQCDFLDKGG